MYPERIYPLGMRKTSKVKFVVEKKKTRNILYKWN